MGISTFPPPSSWRTTSQRHQTRLSASLFQVFTTTLSSRAPKDRVTPCVEMSQEVKVYHSLLHRRNSEERGVSISYSESCPGSQSQPLAADADTVAIWYLSTQGPQSPDGVEKPSPLYAADWGFGRRRTSLSLDSDACLPLPDRQVSSSPQKPAPPEAEKLSQKCDSDLQTKYLN